MPTKPWMERIIHDMKQQPTGMPHWSHKGNMMEKSSHRWADMNKATHHHLMVGDLTDIYAEDDESGQSANFGDTDAARALGAAIWNVQHQAWSRATVTFEDQHNEICEIDVIPIFTKDINGIKRPFECQLAITDTDGVVRTENVSYDSHVQTTVNTSLFTTPKKA